MTLDELKGKILDELEPDNPVEIPAIHVTDLSDYNSEHPDHEMHFRFVYPMGFDAFTDAEYRALAYDVTTEAFSNLTNNDACDISVRERSAHLDLYPELELYHDLPFASVVILDVTIDDSLS